MTTGNTSNKLIVIGGGAAGFFCAINAARLNPSLQVLILEKSNQLLSKVKVSGGGRCNVTNSCEGISALAANYPRGAQFLKKAFHQFNNADTVKWFEQRGVQLKAEADGRIFPVTNSSQTIIDALIAEANRCKVEVIMKASVSEIIKQDEQFQVILEDARKYTANNICIATGGFSKESQFEWIKKLGHQIETPVPSLFTFNLSDKNLTQLMGISVPLVKVKIVGTKLVQTGPLLITHWGISGPAVLKLSAWGARDLAKLNYHFSVLINWLEGDGFTETSLKEKLVEWRISMASQKIMQRNFTSLPARLWQFLCHISDIDAETRFASLTSKAENRFIKNLTAFEVAVKGKTSFKEEFVTAGGVSLSEVDHTTMQSKVCTGLYFAGEILDIDGVTGGFNFQNAWTTSYIAASSIAGK
jgi:predicted Rossmann fold flavoprotein